MAGTSYYNRDNPPPWWLINLGPIIASICITFLASIIGCLFYMERKERLEKEAAEAAKEKLKKDD